MIVSTLFIMTNQLLGMLRGTADLLFYEMSKPLSMGSVLELKVDTLTVLFLSDVCAFLLGVMFQDQLLKEQEGSLVVHLLPDLHLTLPQMGCVGFLAVFALQILDDVFDNECLLQQGSLENVLLNCNFDLQSS